jgi:zinc transporter ZupT
MALFAAMSLIFGSVVPISPWMKARVSSKKLSLLIGFSAGLMLATALHNLVPEAMEMNHDRAIWGVGFGFLALYVVERLTHFHACRHLECDVSEDVEGQQSAGGSGQECAHDHAHNDEHHGHSHASSTRNAPVHASHSHALGHSHAHADTMALAGMSVHNFADGLTTAAAFAISKPVGIVVFIAILLHQMAAGLSLGAIMMRAGRNRKRVLISTFGYSRPVNRGLARCFLSRLVIRGGRKRDGRGAGHCGRACFLLSRRAFVA